MSKSINAYSQSRFFSFDTKKKNVVLFKKGEDYCAFGSPMPGRVWVATGVDKYRFGFNGKEQDSETQTQDYGMRIYNSMLGRFLSVDPLSITYPYYTPYQFSGNSPLANVDIDGLEELHYTKKDANSKQAALVIAKEYHVVNKGSNSVTDPNYIQSQIQNARNVYDQTYLFNFVKVLPGKDQEMVIAGSFEIFSFFLRNLFKSEEEKKANYQKKYWDLEVSFDITIVFDPETSLGLGNKMLEQNPNCIGVICEAELEITQKFVAGKGELKIPNQNSMEDDIVFLKRSFYGFEGEKRYLLEKSGDANGGELIGHEIGHNLLGETHHIDSTTGEQDYSKGGIGSNASGLKPTKAQTRNIVNSSVHTLK